MVFLFVCLFAGLFVCLFVWCFVGFFLLFICGGSPVRCKLLINDLLQYIDNIVLMFIKSWCHFLLTHL